MSVLKKIFILGISGLLLYLAKTNWIIAYQYPIPELGNCRDQKECHLFCEIPENKPACWSYRTYSNDVLGEETPEQTLERLGVTFPVAQLGNCTSVSACRQYCELPQNQAACRSFSQSYGLANQDLLVQKAQQELGCTSREECRAFCNQEKNQEACQAFVKRYHLRNTAKERVLKQAQRLLNCSSLTECKQLCSQQQNQDKCQKFALQNNLPTNPKQRHLLETAMKQLGCGSFAECKEFCSQEENKTQCTAWGYRIQNLVQDKIQDKLGCTTTEECRQICQENPANCPGFPHKPSNRPWPSLLPFPNRLPLIHPSQKPETSRLPFPTRPTYIPGSPIPHQADPFQNVQPLKPHQ